MPQIAIAGLETAFNRLLKLDPEAADKLEPMSGRIICLHITGLNIRLFFFPSVDEVMILDDFDGEAETTISGPPLALARLKLADNSQAEMFAGDVEITGDLRLGRQFNQLLATLDIDWEEQLSGVVGDFAAHTLGNIGRSLFGWNARNTDSMKMNIGEYLQEEVGYLPSRNELDLFMNRVDGLRNDVARFEARLARLQKQYQEKSQPDNNTDN